MSTQPGSDRNSDRSDPIGDFQRWLMKAGAKSLGREVAGRVKSTLGGGGGMQGSFLPQRRGGVSIIGPPRRLAAGQRKVRELCHRRYSAKVA